MLSLLIPIYNYNACPLVSELHRQALFIGKPFEIICIDDASTQFLSENSAVASLSNCTLIELPQNIGRSKIRNLLASKAKFDWLLFLDCDTFPKENSFLEKYFSQITATQNDAYFGGLFYKNERPETNKRLRWEFGRKREAIALEKRKKNPYQTTLVSNFLIKKTIFDGILFDETITKYGYEDALFIQALKKKKTTVQHIENPLFHLNLETSEQFISKTKSALETLQFLSDKYSGAAFETKITKTYNRLSFLQLHFPIARLFELFRLPLENNLTSKKPSLFLFDCYKIGYFCFLKNQ